jgi:hypothetical protein
MIITTAGVDYSDITFWLNGNGSWSDPDYTMDTVTTPTEYSASDSVASGSGAADFNVGSKDCGTYGSDFPTEGDYFDLTTGISSIHPGSDTATFQGRIALRFYYTTWDVNMAVWRAWYDSNSRVTLTTDNSEEFQFAYKYGGTSVYCGTTDANLTSSTWYTVEVWWDANANAMGFTIDGSAPGLDASCTSSTLGTMSGAMANFRWGSWLEPGPADWWIGMVAVSSDKTRDFHDLFVTKSICDYPG